MSNNEIPPGNNSSADEIAKHALEIKEQHGDYWKYLHDEAYKHYDNDKSGTGSLSFQNELNKKLRDEHILGGQNPTANQREANGPPTPLYTYPLSGQKNTEVHSAPATPAPTTYPGVAFGMHPTQPSSYYPPEQQVARPAAPAQAVPQTGSDYHPGVIQRTDLPTPGQAQTRGLAPGAIVPPPQDYHAGAVQRTELPTEHSGNPNDPAVKAADEIAKRALEMKEQHGDYWKFIHDESYKYYRNEKSDASGLRFQNELNKRLHDEHLIGGEVAHQPVTQHPAAAPHGTTRGTGVQHPAAGSDTQHPGAVHHHERHHKEEHKHKDNHLPAAWTSPDAYSHWKKAVTENRGAAATPPATEQPATGAAATPPATENPTTGAAAATPTELERKMSSPETLKAWQDTATQQELAAAQQALRDKMTSPETLKAWQDAATQQELREKMTSPQTLDAWHKLATEEEAKEQYSNSLDQKAIELAKAASGAWTAPTYTNNLGKLRDLVKETNQAATDGKVLPTDQVLVNKYFAETLLKTPYYGNDRQASYNEAQKAVEQIDKLQPSFRASDTDFQTLVFEKLNMPLPESK